MPRSTRLTNGFAKQVENCAASVFCTPWHATSSGPLKILTKRPERKTTPAMAAGVAGHVWTVSEIAQLLGSDETTRN